MTDGRLYSSISGNTSVCTGCEIFLSSLCILIRSYFFSKIEANVLLLIVLQRLMLLTQVLRKYSVLLQGQVLYLSQREPGNTPLYCIQEHVYSETIENIHILIPFIIFIIYHTRPNYARCITFRCTMIWRS